MHSQPWHWGSCDDKASGSYSLWLADALPSAHLENHLPHRYLFQSRNRGIQAPDSDSSMREPVEAMGPIRLKGDIYKRCCFFGSPDDGFGCLELWNMFKGVVFFFKCVCSCAVIVGNPRQSWWTMGVQSLSTHFNCKFRPQFMYQGAPHSLVFIWSRVKP